MNHFLKISFGPLDMYEILTCILMLSIYYSYSYIKKRSPEKLHYISKIVLILAMIYIVINITLKIREQDVYIFTIPFIVVGFILRNKSKNDIRGIEVLKIINSQKNWDKKEEYFFPKDFTDEELKVIESKLKDIFNEINNNFGDKNIGGLFIWIKKKKNAKTIRIINVLDVDKKEEIIILKKIYNKISRGNYGEVDLEEGLTNKLELNIII